jgi:hypothetical protein
MANIRILEASFGLLENMPENIKSVIKSIGVRLTADKEKNVLLIQGKIDGLLREYNNLTESQKDKKKEEKPTMQSYIDTLTVISTHFKMCLDIHKITVASFLSYYNLFTKEVEAFNRVNRKIK